jgi:hypothetical protein
LNRSKHSFSNSRRRSNPQVKKKKKKKEAIKEDDDSSEEEDTNVFLMDYVEISERVEISDSDIVQSVLSDMCFFCGLELFNAKRENEEENRIVV